MHLGGRRRPVTVGGSTDPYGAEHPPPGRLGSVILVDEFDGVQAFKPSPKPPLSGRRKERSRKRASAVPMTARVAPTAPGGAVFGTSRPNVNRLSLAPLKKPVVRSLKDLDAKAPSTVVALTAPGQGTRGRMVFDAKARPPRMVFIDGEDEDECMRRGPASLGLRAPAPVKRDQGPYPFMAGSLVTPFEPDAAGEGALAVKDRRRVLVSPDRALYVAWNAKVWEGFDEHFVFNVSTQMPPITFQLSVESPHSKVLVLVSREHHCPSPSQCQWSSASTFTLKGAACRPGQYHITVHTYGKREERFQLNVITGEWKDGSPLRNNGVWKAPARDGGHTFEGEWKQGRPYAGKGSWRNPDGHLFSGTWVVGLRQGLGEIHYKNGDLYVGNLTDDLKDGKGCIDYASGDKFVGEFHQGFRNGSGVLRFADLGAVYEGEWENDVYSGKGTYTQHGARSRSRMRKQMSQQAAASMQQPGEWGSSPGGLTAVQEGSGSGGGGGGCETESFWEKREAVLLQGSKDGKLGQFQAQQRGGAKDWEAHHKDHSRDHQSKYGEYGKEHSGDDSHTRTSMRIKQPNASLCTPSAGGSSEYHEDVHWDLDEAHGGISDAQANDDGHTVTEHRARMASKKRGSVVNHQPHYADASGKEYLDYADADGADRRIHKGDPWAMKGVDEPASDGSDSDGSDCSDDGAPYSSYTGKWLHGKRHGHGVFADEEGVVYDGAWYNDLKQGNGTIIDIDGSTYKGMWHNDLRHGEGRLTRPDGTVMEGEWDRGTPVDCTVVERTAGGDVYTGPIVGGMRAGHGVFKHANGDVYEGGFKANLKSGEGEIRYANGDVFSGAFALNIRLNGKGRMRYADGSLYIGQWKKEMRHADGEMSYHNGDAYSGKWEHGRRCGRGQLTCINGDVFEGEWRNDERDGVGVLTCGNSDRYEGQWKHGKRHGQGSMAYFSVAGYTATSGEELERYDGTWLDDKKTAYGEYRFANKDVYKGQWVADGRNGEGTIFYFDNPIFSVEGVWKDGQMDGRATKTVFREGMDIEGGDITTPMFQRQKSDTR